MDVNGAPQRYRAHKQAVADPEGRFVLYTDYAAIRAELLDECRKHQDRIRECEQQERRIGDLEAILGAGGFQ